MLQAVKRSGYISASKSLHTRKDGGSRVLACWRSRQWRRCWWARPWVRLSYGCGWTPETSVDLERRAHTVIDCEAETFRIDGGVVYRIDGRHVQMPEVSNSPTVAIVPDTQISVLAGLVCDKKWVTYTEQALGLYAALALVPPPTNAKEIRELLIRDGFELPRAPFIRR